MRMKRTKQTNWNHYHELGSTFPLQEDGSLSYRGLNGVLSGFTPLSPRHEAATCPFGQRVSWYHNCKKGASTCGLLIKKSLICEIRGRRRTVLANPHEWRSHCMPMLCCSREGGGEQRWMVHSQIHLNNLDRFHLELCWEQRFVCNICGQDGSNLWKRSSECRGLWANRRHAGKCYRMNRPLKYLC